VELAMPPPDGWPSPVRLDAFGRWERSLTRNESFDNQ